MFYSTFFSGKKKSITPFFLSVRLVYLNMNANFHETKPNFGDYSRPHTPASTLPRAQTGLGKIGVNNNDATNTIFEDYPLPPLPLPLSPTPGSTLQVTQNVWGEICSWKTVMKPNHVLKITISSPLTRGPHYQGPKAWGVRFVHGKRSRSQTKL